MILQWIQAILCYTERGVFGGVSKRLWNVVCVVFDGTNIPWKVTGLFWWRLLHVLSACVNFAPQASFSEGGVRRDWELSTQWLVSLSLNLLAESLWLRLQVPASVNHFAVHILYFFFSFNSLSTGPLFVAISTIVFLLNRLGVIESSIWRLCHHYDFLVKLRLDVQRKK